LEEVFRAIIRGSVERQHRVGVALRERRGERLLIVGGAGGMGAWFRSFFSLAGHRCDLLDPAFAGLPPEAGRFAGLAEVPDVARYAALLVAVPLARTAEVVGSLLAPAVAAAGAGGHPRCPLIIEISSIKAPLAPVLAQARRDDVRVLALHPMFGPRKSLYEPLTFVLGTQRDPDEERAE